jgi:hypothetical protein
VLGQGGPIPVADAVTLLDQEHIPEHVAPRPISLTSILATAAHIALMVNVPEMRAVRRAKEAVRVEPDPGVEGPGPAPERP